MKQASKEKTGYIYWSRETGNITDISPTPLENPKTDNPPLEVPMAEIALFTSGKLRHHHYYVSIGKKSKKYEIKKKDLDFSWSVSDIARADSLLEVLSGERDSELRVEVSKQHLTLFLNVEDENIPRGHFSLYITPEGNPYELLQEFKINLDSLKFARARDTDYILDLNSYDSPFSIWVTPLFRSYERCKA